MGSWESNPTPLVHSNSTKPLHHCHFVDRVGEVNKVTCPCCYCAVKSEKQKSAEGGSNPRLPTGTQRAVPLRYGQGY